MSILKIFVYDGESSYLNHRLKIPIAFSENREDEINNPQTAF